MGAAGKVVIGGEFIIFLLHNQFMTDFFFKKNPAKQKTAYFFPFLFCFTRELNLLHLSLLG
jgi:hypothetical protein